MFERLLERLAGSLDRHKIPYMVIGGQAVLVYGEPRLTRDIDVTVGVDANRTDAMLAVARELGLDVRVEHPAEFVRDTMVLPCEDVTSGIPIDFIFSRSTYEVEALTRVRSVTVGSGKVAFASLEDLIIHKLIAGRPRDLEDVRTILLKNRTYDRAYVAKWLVEFDKLLDRPLARQLKDLDPG